MEKEYIIKDNKDNKQEAFKQLSEIQQKLVQEFTVDWD